MKRFFAFLLALTLSLSLFACAEHPVETTPPTNTTAPETKPLVGFGEGDITATWPIGLQGYGNEKTRISNGIKTYIYIHCVAITDTTGETVLLMSIDAGGGGFQSTVRPLIEEEFGIPQDHVMLSAIHQHSTPIGTKEYLDLIKKGTRKAVKQALEDQAPADMYINKVTTNALSFVRNYICNDGSFYGPNYGSAASGIKAHESESDKEMRLIKFDRGPEKKPIIMVNFQAHPHMGAGSSDNNQHADWPGIMRETLAEELGCHAMYLSGAGGNLNSNSSIKEENISTDWKDHGKRAAQYVIDAEDSYTPVEMGKIKIHIETNAYANNHSKDYLYKEALALHNMRAEDFSAAVAAVQNANPEIHSIYHASAIVNQYKAGPSRELTIGVISLGDVAFTLHPYEMFDTNGMELRDGTVGNPNYQADEQLENPYAMTFVCTLANGHLGYVPSMLGYTNGGYSTDIAYLEPGSGERLVGDYLRILNDLHE